MAERLARNAATFRTANGRISDVARAQHMVEAVPFLCECADERCLDIIRMSLDEYESVRSHSTDFLNTPGHEAAVGSAGEVIASNHRYVVVRKRGLAGELVDELHPRTAA